MTLVKISELPALTARATDDVIPIVDTSATTTKSITVSGLLGIIRKTSDQTLTQSNTTLQNVTDLSFSIAVSEHWFAEAFLFLNAASGNADYKFGWTGPTGASANWGIVSNRGEAISPGGAWIAAAAANTPMASVTLADSVPIGAQNVNFTAMALGIFVADASHAGTIQFQAAQNTSQAENNKVLTDSFLRVTRLA